MKRILIICTVSAAISACSARHPKIVYAGAPTWEVNNALAIEQHKWAELRNARVIDPAKAGTLPADELQQWQRVKAGWERLKQEVDAEYRGNGNKN